MCYPKDSLIKEDTLYRCSVRGDARLRRCRWAIVFRCTAISSSVQSCPLGIFLRQIQSPSKPSLPQGLLGIGMTWCYFGCLRRRYSPPAESCPPSSPVSRRGGARRPRRNDWGLSYPVGSRQLRESLCVARCL